MKKTASYLIVFALGAFSFSMAYVMADGFGLHKHRSADIIDSSGGKVDTSRFPKKDGAETISGAWTHSATTDITGTFQIGGTTVNATATEINLLSGQTTLGDVSLAGNNTFSGTNNFTSTFQLGGVSVTSTATEINLLDGVTAVGDVRVGANNTLSGTSNFTGTFQIGGTTVSSTAAELNFLDGASYAGGVNTCPTNFSRVGPAFGRDSFCMTSAEQPADDWFGANDTCIGMDTGTQGPAHMCTDIEWYTACTEGEDTGETDIANLLDSDEEWVGDHNGHLKAASMGNHASNCLTIASTAFATEYVFRCCFP
jgi:hypothetical protein